MYTSAQIMRHGPPRIARHPRMPRRLPRRHSIMVKSGHKTGTYYITLEQLPSDATSQELKAFIGEACPADDVAVFAESTSGWVRLRGQSNFEMALRKLRCNPFKGRYIIFSDKNRFEPVPVKQPAGTNQHSMPNQPPAVGSWTRRWLQQLGDRHITPNHHIYAPPSTLLPQMPHLPPLLPHLTQTKDSNQIETAMPMLPNISQSGCFSNTNAWVPGSSNALASAGVCAGHLGAHAYPYGTTGSATVLTDSVPFELALRPGPRSRKLMITRFGRRTQYFQIDQWIRAICGAIKISRLDIPLGGKRVLGPPTLRRTRGKAFILFEDASAAAKAFTLLANHQFNGKTLGVSFLTENCAQRASSSENSTAIRWPSSNTVITPGDHGSFDSSTIAVNTNIRPPTSSSFVTSVSTIAIADTNANDTIMAEPAEQRRVFKREVSAPVESFMGQLNFVG